MYAVIKTGGKQYRVSKDDVIVVEKLAANTGSALELDEVLILDDGKETVLGTPMVEGARVAATVLDQTRSDKIIVFKKKRRKDYKRKKGHRQDLTVLRITDILAKGQKATTAKVAVPKSAAVPEPKMEEAITAPVSKAAVKKAPAKKAAAKKAVKKATAKKAAAKKTSAKKAPAKK
jgi:large subunit ribosomal protein L21